MQNPREVTVSLSCVEILLLRAGFCNILRLRKIESTPYRSDIRFSANLEYLSNLASREFNTLFPAASDNGRS